MDVKILSQPAFSVMGLLERGIDDPTLIPPIWNRYFSHWEKVEPHILSHTAYGVMDNYDETSGAFDYLAGHAVSADLQALPGLTVWQIPIQLYAVLACTVPSVRDAYAFFLLKSGCPQRSAPAAMARQSLKSIQRSLKTWNMTPCISTSRSKKTKE